MGRPVNTTKRPIITLDDENEEVEIQQAHATDDNTKDRVIFLAGEIQESNAANIIQKMISLSQLSAKPIWLVVSTYGGSIDESMAIYDTMKLIRSPIHTIGLGKIMSAGVLLLAAGAKGKRLIGSSARVMIHNAWQGVVGDPIEVENELKEFKRLAKYEEDCLIKETKITRKQLNAILKKRTDSYFTATETVKLGIADKIT